MGVSRTGGGFLVQTELFYKVEAVWLEEIKLNWKSLQMKVIALAFCGILLVYLPESRVPKSKNWWTIVVVYCRCLIYMPDAALRVQRFATRAFSVFIITRYGSLSGVINIPRCPRSQIRLSSASNGLQRNGFHIKEYDHRHESTDDCT